jgi:hypothetical protein
MASDTIAPTPMPTNLCEYQALTAGSTAIMPDGKVLRFAGPPNGVGTFITSIPEEIAFLDKLDASPTAQVRKVQSALGAPEAFNKQQIVAESAPGVAAIGPAAEVVEQATRAGDPQVTAAQDGLAALIANNSVAR